VSEFLTGKVATQQEFARQAYWCDVGSGLDRALAQRRWKGWGVNASNQRFQPAAIVQLAAADVPRLKVEWAFAFPGNVRTYAQPAAMPGPVFVGRQGTRVYSLNASNA
jgi:polyvinyl alcohol dehydrogenase (cytochrome)